MSNDLFGAFPAHDSKTVSSLLPLRLKHHHGQHPQAHQGLNPAGPTPHSVPPPQQATLLPTLALAAHIPIPMASVLCSLECTLSPWHAPPHSGINQPPGQRHSIHQQAQAYGTSHPSYPLLRSRTPTRRQRSWLAPPPQSPFARPASAGATLGEGPWGRQDEPPWVQHNGDMGGEEEGECISRCSLLLLTQRDSIDPSVRLGVEVEHGAQTHSAKTISRRGLETGEMITLLPLSEAAFDFPSEHAHALAR
ncbi:hypothetical protein BDQ17DRAFT_643985, partial [Cyathus striatus]